MYNIYTPSNSCTNYRNISDALESGRCLSTRSAPNRAGVLLSGLSPGVHAPLTPALAHQFWKYPALQP